MKGNLRELATPGHPFREQMIARARRLGVPSAWEPQPPEPNETDQTTLHRDADLVWMHVHDAMRRHLGQADLAGRTLGIVGFGRIGAFVARQAIACGMRVLANDTGDIHSNATRLRVEHSPLDDLLQAADVVSLHCDLNRTSRHLVDARSLGLMRTGSLLINTSRADLIDAEALADALLHGALGGAALDSLRDDTSADTMLLANHERVHMLRAA